MRYPEFLKDNGSIGFVAPSFGCNIEPYKSAFDNALKKFKGMGYKTVLGPNCYKGEGVGISNLPKECGDELNKMYKSDDADVIISCGGGELMCEVLPFIDWNGIKESKPKWYLGYSDNTNFTFLSTILADTAAIYGSCVPSFGMEPWADSIKDTFDLLTGKIDKVSNYPKWEKEGLKDEEHPLMPYNLTEPYSQKNYNIPENEEETSIEGRLIGGCLDILVNLCGTEFDKVDEFLERYKNDGFIWFIESCDLSMLDIRRAFFHLEHAGWFKYAKGFLIGRPYRHGEEMMGVDQYNAVLSIIEEKGVPIVMDIDIGHIPSSMPMISGAYSKVDIKQNEISVKYEFIK